MAELASDTIFDILSRLPVKSLAHFRCVSKRWCAYIDDDYLSILHGERAVEELTPIMYEPNLSCITCFSIIKSGEGETTMEAKKGISLESELYELCSTYCRYVAGGSCNGLLYLSLSRRNTLYTTYLAVIHPLRKEFYALLPMHQWLDGPYSLGEESRGLGFDVSTNTFKMVLVLSKIGFARNYLCTMVYVLGMNISWREIPEVPPYPTSGDGIFARGCLYWLATSQKKKCLICFDVRNEEFMLIYCPKRRRGCSVTHHQLVDLQGELGYAYYYSDDIIEVSVLKQKQWVKHCQFSIKPQVSPDNVEVLGRWNKYGDLLIKSSAAGRNNWFVDSLKSRVLDKVNIIGQEYGSNAYLYMYPASSMLSVRSINKSSAPSIKADLNTS